MSTNAELDEGSAADSRASGSGFRPAFWRVWTSDIVSQVGDALNVMARVWVVLKADSSFDLGMILVAATLPQAIFSHLAGRWLDRWIGARRRILAWSYVLRAPASIGMGLLALEGRYDGPGMLALVAVLGAGRGVQLTAIQAMIPSLVRPESVGSATSLVATNGRITQVAGPGAAGALVAVAGAPALFFADAITYLFSWALVAGSSQGAPAPKSEPASSARPWVLGKALKRLAASYVAMTLFGMAAYVALPVLARRAMDVSSSELGVVLSLNALGFAVGALGLYQLVRGFDGRVVSFGFSILTAVSFLAAAAAPTYPALCLAVAAGGATWGVVQVVLFTWAQRLVVDEDRGRAFAMIGVAATLATVGGFFAAGIFVDRIGAREVLTVVGVGFAVSALPLLWMTRNDRPWEDRS